MYRDAYKYAKKYARGAYRYLRYGRRGYRGKKPAYTYRHAIAGSKWWSWTRFAIGLGLGASAAIGEVIWDKAIAPRLP